MASLASSTSLEESPEYITLRECHVVLIDLLKPSIGSLGDVLFAKGLVPQDTKDNLRMSLVSPADKTREVIDCITNRVKYNPGAYQEFVKILTKQGQWCELVVEKLSSCYEAQTATPLSSIVPLSNSESQRKLRLEFTVPQDVPPEAIKALEAVQVSVLYKDQNKSSRAFIESPLRVERDNQTKDPQIPWYDDPGIAPGASGGRDILFIVSDVTPTTHLDIVPRRYRTPLTDEERRKLEKQGIHRKNQHSDLSIMMARYELDRWSNIVTMLSREQTSCEEVWSRLTDLMKTSDKEGVSLYYIGPGKKGTGDWCFSDGFITFRDLMKLYIQHFKGCVLRIVSDCSYSGSWVREAMAFMDEQGVGPCGHMAKEKGILVKMYASCRANEIPAELAFSTQCVENGEAQDVLYYLRFQTKKIHEDQHPSGIDFTQVLCNNKIDQPCTMAPGSTWHQWSIAKRIRIVRGEDRRRPTWHFVLLADDNDTIAKFHDTLGGDINVADYGQILKSGWGKDLPDEVRKSIVEHYFMNYNY